MTSHAKDTYIYRHVYGIVAHSNLPFFTGYTSSSKMQMSKTIPSGTNWCQQIPGKLILRYILRCMSWKRHVGGGHLCFSKTKCVLKMLTLSLPFFFTSPVLPWKPGTKSSSVFLPFSFVLLLPASVVQLTLSAPISG